MKKIFLMLVIVFLTSCAYEGGDINTYIDDPATFIRDPHFSKYQEKCDALDHAYYVEKKMNYSQYLEKKQQIDQVYDKEVQARDEKISSPLK